jgi:hypothetical protein
VNISQLKLRVRNSIMIIIIDVAISGDRNAIKKKPRRF